MVEIYQPEKDSYLLSQVLEKEIPLLLKTNPNLKFLEIGCGSGVQLQTALKAGIKKENIFSGDINNEAVEHCKKLGFNCILSDLFSRFKGGVSVGGCFSSSQKGGVSVGGCFSSSQKGGVSVGGCFSSSQKGGVSVGGCFSSSQKGGVSVRGTLVPPKYDIIIFNPPYLSEDENKDEPKDSQLATTGGKKGSEILNKFLKQVDNYLKKNTKIYILTSSSTKNIDFRHFKKELIAKEKIFYEELYVFKLE